MEFGLRTSLSLLIYLYFKFCHISQVVICLDNYFYETLINYSNTLLTFQGRISHDVGDWVSV